MLVWIIIAVCILVVCGACGWVNRREKIKTEKMQRQQWNQRAKNDNQNKIFVVLPSFASAEVLQTTRLLFERAFVPQRINIGIGAPTSVSVDGLGFFKKQVRVHVLPSYLNIGASVARQQIVAALYDNEPFILVTHAHIVPVQNWDTVLLQSLHTAYQHGGHLISQIPGNVAPGEVSALPLHNVPSTFAVLRPSRSLNKQLPVFSPRFFLGPESAQTTFASPTVSNKCLFGAAPFLIDTLKLFDFPIPLLNPGEDDFLMTLLCFLQGAKVHNPQLSVLFHIKNRSRARSSQYAKSRKLKQYTKAVLQVLTNRQPIQFRKSEVPTVLQFIRNLGTSPQSYFDWLGLNLKTQAVAGRSVLGLTPKSTRAEILHKYRSLDEFETFRNKFCYD